MRAESEINSIQLRAQAWTRTPIAIIIVRSLLLPRRFGTSSTLAHCTWPVRRPFVRSLKEKRVGLCLRSPQRGSLPDFRGAREEMSELPDHQEHCQKSPFMICYSRTSLPIACHPSVATPPDPRVSPMSSFFQRNGKGTGCSARGKELSIALKERGAS